jgi:signal transduction histidine kinase
MGQTLQELGDEISGLRSLIADVGPTALDDLGLEPAISDLSARAGERGLDVALSVDLAYEQGRSPSRLVNELETAV